MKSKILLIFVSGLLVLISCKKDDDNNQPQSKYKTLDGKAPLVIGHRGSPGMRPDHTIEGYSLAIDQGADFVEPDLVLTKDSVLICRHEPMLSGTTNVADMPVFASRKRTVMVDGDAYEDWFAFDFTLAEIKTMYAKQPSAERSAAYNGMYRIPTFQELINLVRAKSIEKGRTVGIYPETKHPTLHESLNLHITDKLLDALIKAGWNSHNSPVYVQSFEVSNLQYLRSKSTVKIVQLYDAYDVDKNGTMVMTAPNGRPYDFVVNGDSRTYNDLATNAGLDFVKTYADGIGPWKPFIVPYTYTDANNDGNADDINADGKVNNTDFTKLPATDLINRAHERGLVVHAYTFRDESRRLLKDYNGDPKAEYKDVYNLGIDGVFSDFPATAVAARE
jgi:glycerophosphoryl diester phosphodiesterase